MSWPAKLRFSSPAVERLTGRAGGTSLQLFSSADFKCRFFISSEFLELADFAQSHAGKAADNDVFAKFSDAFFNVLLNGLIGVFNEWLF